MRFRNIYRLVGNLFERLVGNIFDETKVGIVLLCWAGSPPCPSQRPGVGPRVRPATHPPGRSCPREKINC